VNLALAWMLVPKRPFHMSDRDAAIFISFFLGGILLLWVDFNAIGWVGMWMGLRGFPANRAALNTFARIMAPPLLTVLLFIFIGVNAKPREDAIWGFWMAWVALGVLSAKTAVHHRRAELLRDFRLLASGDKRNTAFDAFLPWMPGWNASAPGGGSGPGRPAENVRPPGDEVRGGEGQASGRRLRL
jgi:hypothetical protein